MEIPAGDWVLRPWQEGDEPALVKYANNRNVWINLKDLFPHPYTMEDAEAWVQSQKDRDPPTNFAIANADEAIGAIGLRLLGDVHRRSAEVGYWLGEPFWGQGIVTHALRALTEHAFATFDLVRLEAFVKEWNPASARVLEKCGFSLEARLRKRVTKDGQTIDQLLYALVREQARSATSGGVKIGRGTPAGGGAAMVDIAPQQTKTRRIDGDSHFFPPPDFTGVSETIGVSEQALDMLLRDALFFSDREARRGGFRASAAGQRTGAVNPTAQTTGQSRGPIGHGVADQRVKLLPETGFEMQVLIPDGIYGNPFGSPIERDWDKGLRLALCMGYNNATADAQRQYPEQLIGTGVVPFGTESVEACAAEARRAVTELGLQALTINSNWRGKNWDSVELYPFWEAVSDLDIPLYVHGNPFQCQVNDHLPTNFTLGWERMRRMHISNYLGFAFEYMVAMASLTLGGVLKEFPNLRMAFFEAGGSWLPWVMYTLDRVYQIEPQCARCEELPSELLASSCLVAVEPDEQAIVGAVHTIGSRNFIIGSDYPHPPSTFPNTAAGIETMEGLSDEAKRDILGDNMARFFRMA